MPGTPGHTLTPDSARTIAGAVRRTLRQTREGYNLTRAAGFTSPVTPETIVWPVKVTGDPPTGTAELSVLYEGKLQYPKHTNAYEWTDGEDVYILPFPGQTLDVDEVILCRVSGVASDGKVVYTGGCCGTESPLTTKGDIWGYSSTDARIPIGSDGKVLTADSANALGVSWQTPSSGSGTLVCEVTAVSSHAHTVKRKKYSSGIVDSTGPVTFTNCRSTTGADLPVGTLVSLDPIPDVAGNYWITPVSYATSSLPGLVSTTTQQIAGDKEFTSNVSVDGGFTAQGASFFAGPADFSDYAVFRSFVSVFSVGSFGDTGATSGGETVGANAGTNQLIVYDGYQTGAGTGAFAVQSTFGGYSTTADRRARFWGGTAGTTQPGEVQVNGVIRFKAIADSTAPNDSLYLSSTSGKYSIKDSGGTITHLN